MQDNSLKIWKRKKIEVEERIFKLKQIRQKTQTLLADVSKKKNKLIWSRAGYKQFTQKTQQRFAPMELITTGMA